MSVSRLDVKYAVLKPSPSAEQAVGLYLCTADRTTSEGLASHKSAVRAPSEVVAQSGFTDIQEAVLVTTLEPETPYVLVSLRRADRRVRACGLLALAVVASHVHYVLLCSSHAWPIHRCRR